jgi:lipopolysaccharide cholinephosphotransferase
MILAHWRSCIKMDDVTKKKLRQVQLQILDRIVQICKDYSLRYCLCAGTCLGAIRHMGFIPWDDDIDVMMPREDFSKFIDITSTENNPDFFLDYYITNPNYGRCFAKYCKRNTLFIEPNGLDQAIYVDIFVQDKVPSPEFTAKSKVPTFIHKLDAITTVRREGLKGRDNKTRIIYWLTKWIPIKWIFKWETHLMTRFENTDARYYINYGSAYNLVKETIEICEIEPYEQKVFEGKLYNVPRNWDLYLSRIYGDYMTLPPVEKRVTHYPQYISFDTDKDDFHNE